MRSSSRANSITSLVCSRRRGQHGDLAPGLFERNPTTRRCSARVSVGLSPVVPQGTRKLMPALDLAPDQRAERLFIERKIALERGYQRGATACECEHVPPPLRSLWGRFVTCGPSGTRPVRRLPIAAQDAILPHKFTISLRTRRNPSCLSTNARIAGATGEAFAASCGVPQCNRIGGRIEANFVRAGVRAGAVGTYVDRARIAHLFISSTNFKSVPDGASFLVEWWIFPSPGAVLRLGGKQTGRPPTPA